MLNHLVVGSNGTIGAALFAHLKMRGAFVHGTTQRKDRVKEPALFYLNLLDQTNFPQWLTLKFDVVYLCAGICRMALCEEDTQGTRKVNVEGMMTFIKYLARSSAFVIYLSTNQVFSGDTPFVPAMAPYQPLNEYGQQKAIVEAWLKTHYPNSAILRLTKVVEPKMPLIQNWIDSLIQYQSVAAYSDMTLAPVSLGQVLDVLVSLGQERKPGCYQLSGAQDISYYDLALYLAQTLGKDRALVKSASAYASGIKNSFLPRFTTLDCSSTIALCGEKPPHFSAVMQACFDFL